MVRKVIGVGFAVLGTLAAAGGNAQVTKAAGGYLLRVHYTKGQVMHDVMTNTLVGFAGAGAKPMHFAMPVTVRVTEAHGHSATLQIMMGTVQIGGMKIPGKTAVATINDRNQSTEGGSQLPGATELPAKALHVGDTWTSTTPINTGMGNGSVLKSICRFEGIRTSGGPPVAVISYRLTGTAEGSGKETLLIKDGTLYSSESDLKLGGITVHSVLKRE